ncbi:MULTISPECIES: hypothetical protein [unclassified Halomonas]|uniref:hypothetical protein n=1 Tax=unclassified Halomonas TaxID=2609666 RepID=UPI001EF44137|nr:MULTISPECIES: hypothetical protein [unclassified Halomonas]MCG7589664.1 hypothetical protein [Halomonas sp. McD50-5]MCG7616287.1 hypothetical protein [Halomonas sp. McD50-4]
MWSIVAAIIAAFLSSFLTTIFASRRYRDERAWDRKASAYAEVISGIKKSIRYSETFQEMYESRDNGDYESILSVLLDESKAAKIDVEKTTDSHYIFLSEKAINKIETYLYDDSHLLPELSSEELAEEDTLKNKQLLKELVEISQQELSHSSSHLYRHVLQLHSRIKKTLKTFKTWIKRP